MSSARDLYEMNFGQVFDYVEKLVPLEIVWGDLCGIACEACPLRPWKASAVSKVWCGDILAGLRASDDAVADAGGRATGSIALAAK